jgi:THO complex subunit 7
MFPANGSCTHSRLCRSAIEALASDMADIRREHDAKERAMAAQRAALHAVVRSVGALRLIGADDGADADGALEAGEEREGLNPAAPAFEPRRAGTPPADDGAPDVEMGEVAETKGRRRKLRDEELEEGEATDGSSDLSEPLDDA